MRDPEYWYEQIAALKIVCHQELPPQCNKPALLWMSWQDLPVSQSKLTFSCWLCSAHWRNRFLQGHILRVSAVENYFWSCIQGEYCIFTHYYKPSMWQAYRISFFHPFSSRRWTSVLSCLLFFFKIQYAKVLDSFYYLIYAKIIAILTANPYIELTMYCNQKSPTGVNKINLAQLCYDKFAHVCLLWCTKLMPLTTIPI